MIAAMALLMRTTKDSAAMTQHLQHVKNILSPVVLDNTPPTFEMDRNHLFRTTLYRVLSHSYTLQRSATEPLRRIKVTFLNEPGIDDGGLTREWLELIGTDISTAAARTEDDVDEFEKSHIWECQSLSPLTQANIKFTRTPQLFSIPETSSCLLIYEGIQNSYRNMPDSTKLPEQFLSANYNYYSPKLTTLTFSSDSSSPSSSQPSSSTSNNSTGSSSASQNNSLVYPFSSEIRTILTQNPILRCYLCLG